MLQLTSKRAIAPERVESFKEQLVQARRRIECLLRTRERSAEELRCRLKMAGFPEKIVTCAVEEVLLSGLVDDERFVELYIRGKKNSGWGQLRIETALRGFGIDIRLWDGYPESFFSREEELKRAEECLAKSKSNAKNQRAASYKRLISKGFGSDISLEVLQKLTI